MTSSSKKGKKSVAKRKLIVFTVPSYTFLGPGTDLKMLKYSPALNKLDQVSKEHDLRQNNPNITTEEADERFLEQRKGTGFVGGLARAAIRAKMALGLNDYFRGDIEELGTVYITDYIHAIQNLETCETSGQNA